MPELQGVKGREAAGFTSALRETFKTIVFPTGKSLRKVDDFRMEFDRNDYSGEQQIVDTLDRNAASSCRATSSDAEFDNLRQDAEEFLFDADAVSNSLASPQRRCPPGLVLAAARRAGTSRRTAVQRGYWREKDGLVAKKWERRTRVTARQDDFAPNPLDTGRFQLNVTPEDADTVYVSESGPPDPATARSLTGESTRRRVACGLVSGGRQQRVSPSRAIRSSGARPMRVKPDVNRVSGGYKVSLSPARARP